jgi:hypothetical protein
LNWIDFLLFSHGYGHILSDDEPAEQYLQVDPRCYVRQKSLTNYKRSETPHLEKGHLINVNTCPPSSPSSLSPYRQSSFDVAVAHRSQNQQIPLIPSLAMLTQQEIFYTSGIKSFGFGTCFNYTRAFSKNSAIIKEGTYSDKEMRVILWE